MSKISGAHIIVESLKKEGVEVIFGYPGGAVIPIFDVLYSTPEINLILTRHEQAAVHAADGYARSTGKAGVAIVTSGPGATNTVTGLATANFDSVPVVCIAGQVPTSMIGIDAFQEADTTGLTNPVTKHNYLVHDVNELAMTMKNSFYIAKSGRPGPVVIDIPKNVTLEKTEFHYDEKINIRGYKPHLDGHQNQLKKAIQLIEHAKKPLIIVGGGSIISNACEEVREIINKCDIPVTATLNGLGCVEYDSPYFLGMHGMHGTIAANKAIQECDLLIALGSRFDDRATGKLATFAPKAKIIHIDIDTASISKNVTVDVPVVGDLKRVMKQMSPMVKEKKHSEWMERINELKAMTHEIPKNQSRITSFEVFEVINDLIPQETIVATDVGQHQMWTALYYKFKFPRTLLTSGGLGTMGYGFPAAIGAQFANPEKPVICITGDGSFQMNIQELATAVIHKLPIIILVMNNGYLGMVRQWQELFNERRYSATCLMYCEKNPQECQGNEDDCLILIPDFIKVAQAYCAKGVRVKTLDELKKAVTEAIHYTDGPMIIDIITERTENVWPMVPGGASLDEMLKGGRVI
ncbi:MAG: biosynthetic-type acetolactate synthase large subunit [Spirochaetes bacterium]|nr:biosynthetic-type acetolactate synthase large subunit [Spirochaetota bacterium]